MTIAWSRERFAPKPLFDYEQDAARRQALHEQLWDSEELDWWQQVIMSPDQQEVRL